MTSEICLKTNATANQADPSFAEFRPFTDARTPCGVRFLTKPQVLAALGDISATSLWELMVKADFPRPRVLHGDPKGITGRSYWLCDEVEQWMLSRPKRALKTDQSQGGAK